MKAHTLNSVALAAFTAGAVYLSLWTGACGGGQQIREHQDAGIKQAADQADLARPIDSNRITGTAATVAGCLEKRGSDFILVRNDLPPSVATAGTTDPGARPSDARTPDVAAASSPSYHLNAREETLAPFVGKQVKVNGTLSKLEGKNPSSPKDMAEIDVSSATLVADACR
jgi:hypothetical protein